MIDNELVAKIAKLVIDIADDGTKILTKLGKIEEEQIKLAERIKVLEEK